MHPKAWRCNHRRPHVSLPLLLLYLSWHHSFWFLLFLRRVEKRQLCIVPTFQFQHADVYLLIGSAIHLLTLRWLFHVATCITARHYYVEGHLPFIQLPLDHDVDDLPPSYYPQFPVYSELGEIVYVYGPQGPQQQIKMTLLHYFLWRVLAVAIRPANFVLRQDRSKYFNVLCVCACVCARKRERKKKRAENAQELVWARLGLFFFLFLRLFSSTLL